MPLLLESLVGKRRRISSFQFRVRCIASLRFVFFPNMTNEADKLLKINRCKFGLRRVPFQVRLVAKPNPVSTKAGDNVESKAGMSFRIRSLEKLSPSPVCCPAVRDESRAYRDSKIETRKSHHEFRVSNFGFRVFGRPYRLQSVVKS